MIEDRIAVCRTVIDVGGQDSKVTLLTESGEVQKSILFLGWLNIITNLFIGQNPSSKPRLFIVIISTVINLRGKTHEGKTSMLLARASKDIHG